MIFENVRALKAAGKAIVYTTHYMEEAERLCDRVGIMDKGRLLAQGQRARAAGRARGEARSGGRGRGREIRRIEAPDPLAALNALAARQRVDAFRVERPDLEQVFLHLTGRHLRD